MNDLYITLVFVALPGFILFLAAFLAPRFWQAYQAGKRLKEIEGAVPDALLQASLFSQGTAVFEIIDYLSRGDGELGQEFAQALKEVKRGASVEEALQNLDQRLGSAKVGKLTSLLAQGEKTGANLSLVFKDMAEDLLELENLERERHAALVIEKFTLLAAAGLIVPLILGVVAGIVQGFNLDFFSGLSVGGMDLMARKKLLRSALDANLVYLVEFALLSAFFLAFQENNLKKAVFYALALLPLSLGVYFFVSG
jgi:pilus assembly protein TadC